MNQSFERGRVLFRSARCTAFELGTEDLPSLQALFEANAEFFMMCNGFPPRPDEAQREFEGCPPNGLSHTKQWMLGFTDEAERLVAMAAVLSDFVASSIWHISLFIVAPPLHGSGVAKELHTALQEWMMQNGAAWIRLCAIVGNRRAERFWEKLGYAEVRRAEEQTGNVINTMSVFIKPLRTGTVEEYLTLVPGDRPAPAH